MDKKIYLGRGKLIAGLGAYSIVEESWQKTPDSRFWTEVEGAGYGTLVFIRGKKRGKKD